MFYPEKACMCVGEASHVQKVFAKTALKCGYRFCLPKAQQGDSKLPPTGEQL